MSANNKLVVIKLGGHAMDDQSLLDAFSEDLAKLSKDGIKFIIVHGGGPHINALLKQLAIESSFINGLRVTDAPTLAAAEMALCGAVNKAVTRQLLRFSILAAGISGEDANLLKAEIIKPELGFVGKITSVNPAILHTLLSGGFLPVVAPLALSANYEPLNVNADTAAGAIAGSLKADFFLLISDVPGVIDQNKRLIPELADSEITTLIDNGTISGGMIPKVECCQFALKQGCAKAVILNGTKAHSVADFLTKGTDNGTVIKSNQK